MPFDRNLLEAILPEVLEKPRDPDANYANGAHVTWKPVIECMVRDLTLRNRFQYSLDATTVTVRQENGAVVSKQLSGLRDSA